LQSSPVAPCSSVRAGTGAVGRENSWPKSGWRALETTRTAIRIPNKGRRTTARADLVFNLILFGRELGRLQKASGEIWDMMMDFSFQGSETIVPVDRDTLAGISVKSECK
jgi:hypothetical protein